MFKFKIIILPILFSILLGGCEKLFIQPEIGNTNTEIFDYIWKYTDEYYCCFHVKDINWDSIYQQYEPMIDDEMNGDEFTNILNDMLSELKDGTVSLTNARDTIRYEGYYLPYPRNLNKKTVENFYKSADVSYAMLGDVAYVNTFLYDECDNHFEEIRTMTGKLILDMRGLSSELHSRYENTRIWLGESSFTFVEMYKSIVGSLNPQDSVSLGSSLHTTTHGRPVIIYQCPEPIIFDEIVVLCNRQTFYEGNKLAYAFSKIPNCTIIGDYTGGGAELLRTVLLPNSWSLTVPRATLRDNDEYISEGFAPDIFIDDDPMTTDTDEIIEKALELLD